MFLHVCIHPADYQLLQIQNLNFHVPIHPADQHLLKAIFQMLSTTFPFILPIPSYRSCFYVSIHPADHNLLNMHLGTSMFPLILLTIILYSYTESNFEAPIPQAEHQLPTLSNLTPASTDKILACLSHPADYHLLQVKQIRLQLQWILLPSSTVLWILQMLASMLPYIL